MDDERVRRARQLQGVRLQEGTCLLHHPPYERVQVDRLPLQAEHPRADARHVAEVLDQAAQRRGLPYDHLQLPEVTLAQSYLSYRDTLLEEREVPE